MKWHQLLNSGATYSRSFIWMSAGVVALCGVVAALVITSLMPASYRDRATVDLANAFIDVKSGLVDYEWEAHLAPLADHPEQLLDLAFLRDRSLIVASALLLRLRGRRS